MVAKSYAKRLEVSSQSKFAIRFVINAEVKVGVSNAGYNNSFCTSRRSR